jgi:RNA polymerase sigma-70 factor (ECF subfamily)
LPQENIYTEKELLLMISADDEGAFRQIYEQHWNRIYTIAVLYLKSPVAAQDLVQEVFLKVWVNRTKLADINNFSAWLHVIARNLVISILRKKTTQSLPDTEDSSAIRDEAVAVDEQLASKEIAGLIRKAIDQLSPQQQKIYRMSREQGLKLTQIAVQLSLSHNTVREHMSKALGNIRAYLRRYQDTWIMLLPFFIKHILRK